MLITTFAVVLICSLAAFAFARLEFKAKGLAFNLFTLGLMFPVNVAILPVYLLLRQFDQMGLDVIDSTAATRSTFSGASCCRCRARRWPRWRP
jgi:raffinose/stachyose/melibiose transport system permease protein